MVRFFHVNDVQPIVEIANAQYGVTPQATVEEAVAIYKAARANNNAIWDQIMAFVDDNPGSTESEIAAGTIGSDPTKDRQVLILLAIMDHMGLVVADA